MYVTPGLSAEIVTCVSHDRLRHYARKGEITIHEIIIHGIIIHDITINEIT